MSNVVLMWLADNLDLLKTQIKPNSIDLIYIDPPFNSKRNYNMIFDSATNTSEQAFSDIWSNIGYLEELDQINAINPDLYAYLKMLEKALEGKNTGALSYLTNMAIRCWYMRRALKDTGSFYYHCDPTMSHYIKIMLDYIFGQENFRNEVVWCYNTSGKSKRTYPHKHDTLFLYSKTGNYTFNEQRLDAEGKNLSRYNKVDEDGNHYYMRSGKYKVVYQGTIPVNDYWVDLPALTNNQAERLGYPTQKPEALLERIIKASSNPGDTVADFYLGGGTTAAVAYRLERDFIGCDINYRAIQISRERLEKLGAILKKNLIIRGIPNSAAELREMVKENVVGTEKNSRFELEEIVVRYYLKNVVGNQSKVNDNSIDGRFGFTFQGQQMQGIVQVTCGSNKNHFKAFCSEVGKGTGAMGVYITFQDCITDGFVKEAKGYGKIGNVDKVQILSLEELIDRKIQYDLPTEE